MSALPRFEETHGGGQGRRPQRRYGPTKSEPITNRALVAAIGQRIELADQTGRPVPGRRTLAAELDVSEYAVRRALDDMRRALPNRRQRAGRPL